jgi:predicted metal-dependent hydrolase
VAEELSYAVRQVPRGRRLKVRVDPEHGVEVLLPAGAPVRAAAAAVAELRPWIEAQLAERSRLRAQLRRPGTVPYLDEQLALVPQAGRTRTRRRGGELLVPAGAGARASIERWYRRAARAEIGERLERASAASGAPYAGLTIRNQRTRWASCASGGAMSFNWRLLLAPERVLDYVVWHEVCHLEVPDHSPRFWALLSTRCPGWREPASWLAEFGPALVL